MLTKKTEIPLGKNFLFPFGMTQYDSGFIDLIPFTGFVNTKVTKQLCLQIPDSRSVGDS